MKNRLILHLLLSSLSVCLWGQNKFTTTIKEKAQSPIHTDQSHISDRLSITAPASSDNGRLLSTNKIHWSTNPIDHQTRITKFKKSNNNSWMKVSPAKRLKSLSTDDQFVQIVKELGKTFKIKDPTSEFFKLSENVEGHRIHTKYQQQYKGIKIYGAELIAHYQQGALHLLNGRHYPTTEIDVTPSLDERSIYHMVKQAHGKSIDIKPDLLYIVGGQQLSSNLILYPQGDQMRLAYHVIYFPDMSEQWAYIVDAHSGEIIHSHKNSCEFHNHDLIDEHDFAGPQVAQDLDIKGDNITLNVYEENGTYYLLNIAENMYNASRSSLPNEPVGAILTLDALNTSPETDDFVIDHISSTNNRWSDRIAVSAHNNAAIVYKYFENNFSRLSFDKVGSTIYSMVNVAESDGTGMDNAFWNGIAMFYGNGNQAFNTPLAAALDVAAHEFSHGVIQHEANLQYQGEPGALNESFADIFGVLVENKNWAMGEDVVNTSIFRTGALRDLSNPNNGGSRLGDTGWQPKHVSEQYFGNEDNGGVHINSGIPNHAFYQFVRAQVVDLNQAAQIYYKALSDYLTSSSDFQDLRLAVEQSIIDLHGQDQTILGAAAAAFDAVGISDSGEEVSTGEPVTFESNNGTDFVIYFDPSNQSNISVRTVSQEIDDLISQRGLYNTPSVSDDGTIIVFIGLDQNMYALTIDWSDGSIEEILLDDQTQWRNVAISKDGSKIAAIQGDLSQGIYDNQILVVDLVSGANQWYQLYNPTTAQGGVRTGDVLFADALEWDHSSQFVMYDASNQIISLFNDPINYWDIGFLTAWDNNTNSLGDGNILKLYPSLPENVSIGNPTFSKNSPDIIAFDLLDQRDDTESYSILGVNLENGDQGIFYEQSVLGFPNFSTADDLLIFNALTNNGTDVLAVTAVAEDRISASGNPQVFISNANWGVWFNNGSRDLSTATDDPVISDAGFAIYPNPTSSAVTIELTEAKCSPCQYEIYDQIGRVLLSGSIKNESTPIDVTRLQEGNYFLLLRADDHNFSSVFQKL